MWAEKTKSNLGNNLNERCIIVYIICHMQLHTQTTLGGVELHLSYTLILLIERRETLIINTNNFILNNLISFHSILRHSTTLNPAVVLEQMVCVAQACGSAHLPTRVKLMQ